MKGRESDTQKGEEIGNEEVKKQTGAYRLCQQQCMCGIKKSSALPIIVYSIPLMFPFSFYFPFLSRNSQFCQTLQNGSKVLQTSRTRTGPSKLIYDLHGIGAMALGCSIPRIKVQEGKRTVTYLTAIVVHRVMWSTWYALNACVIRLVFLLSTSIIGRSTSWMSSCPSLPFLIQVQEITEQSIKYRIDVHARRKASKPCLWTYFHWAFLLLQKQQKSWTEVQKATFSSIYETSLHVSIRRRQPLWDFQLKCIKCMLCLGRQIALSGTGHRGIQPWSNLWDGMTGTSFAHHVSSTLNNWLCTCSDGTKAWKESSL